MQQRPDPLVDLDREREALGCLLLLEDGTARELDTLPASVLHSRRHVAIREAIDRAIESSTETRFDLLLVRDELERSDEYDEVGGLDYLIELTEVACSAGGAFPDHAERLGELARKRDLHRALTRAAARLREGGDDCSTVESSILEAIEQVDRSEGASGPKQPEMVRAATRKYLADIARGDEGVIPTPITDLNAVIGGWRPGELSVIGARPSMGKSSLAVQAALHAERTTGRPALFFSAEVSAEVLGAHAAATHGGVNLEDVRARVSGPVDLARLDRALCEVAIVVDDEPSLSIAQVQARARRQHRFGGLSVIVIDYLQLFSGTRDRGTARHEEVASISRGLKALARELQVPVVALSQLNRGVEMREDKRPRMGDIRESGAIEQDADLILLLHRPEYYEPGDESLRGLAEIRVVKQRHGTTGPVSVAWNKTLRRFSDLAMDDRFGDPPADWQGGALP